MGEDKKAVAAAKEIAFAMDALAKPDDMPRWWDEASYIFYQAYDPYALPPEER